MIFILIAYLFMIAQAGLQGLDNAVLYSRTGADAFKGNEHKIFVWSRAIFLGYGFFCWFLHPIELILLLFVYPLQYSFFHNGVYQVARGKIAYPQRSVRRLLPLWCYDNARKDGSAKVNYTFNQRKIQFFFSLLLVAFIIYLKHLTNNFIY